MMAGKYRIGTGIAEVTDRAIGLQMQGFADNRQQTKDVEGALFSRAFIVEDPETSKRVVIVSADIWAGTNAVKAEVLTRLGKSFGALYTAENVLISGTHTHSAPGGYAGYRIYDLTGHGFDVDTLECIASGMVASIQKAHLSLGPGNIYLNRGTLQDCGRNRSRGAYLNNLQAERDRYPSETDNEMFLLKFTRQDGNGPERPVGALSWYAIHPTDHGQQNARVSGDNKGYASALFEMSMQTDLSAQETFVAAFANSSAGDVSGNVELGHIPDRIGDFANMQKHGQLQYDKAREMFDFPSLTQLSGSVDFRHTRVDMSGVRIENGNGARTWPAAVGLSFAAGSTEDGVPWPPSGLREGITETNAVDSERVMQSVASWAGKIVEDLPFSIEFSGEVLAGHYPKPVLFALGVQPGLAPTVLPLQILKIGQLVIAGFPGEITTMAGRRLRETLLTALSPVGKHAVIAAYANDYSQYVTTKEEYDMQHYEGASTLFGPFTLLAYQQEFRKLAIALKKGIPVDPGSPAPGIFSPRLNQWRFRNRSDSDVEIKLYSVGASDTLVPLPHGTQTIRAHTEVAFPERHFTGDLLPTVTQADAFFNGGRRMTVGMHPVTIEQSGAITGDIAPGGGAGGYQGFSGGPVSG